MRQQLTKPLNHAVLFEKLNRFLEDEKDKDSLLFDAKTSVRAIGEREFRQRLKALMDIPVTDVDWAGKQRLVREYLAEVSSPAAPAPTAETKSDTRVPACAPQ